MRRHEYKSVQVKPDESGVSDIHYSIEYQADFEQDNLRDLYLRLQIKR